MARSKKEANWGYGRELPPDLWHVAYPACGRRKQSPIDVDTGIAGEIDAGAKLTPRYAKAIKLVEVLVSHHVEVDVSAGGYVQIGRDKYFLQQFHVHVPSEHTIDGNGAAMELHFVHVESGAPARQVVVAVLVKKSGRTNAFLSDLSEHMPLLSSEKRAAAKQSPAPQRKKQKPRINPNRGFPVDRSYYRYEGSLTTPACTENLDWYVLKEPIEAEPHIIECFGKFTPGGNNRPIQNRNGRSIDYFQDAP